MIFSRTTFAASLLLVTWACGGGAGASTGQAGTATGGATTAGSTGAGTAGGSAGTGGTSTGGTGGTTGGAPQGTPGCGTPSVPGVYDQEIEVAGKMRSYKLVIPPGYDGDSPLPIVFAWHARGTTPQLARTYYKVEEASKGGAVFVYPLGLPQASFGGDTGWDLTQDGVDVQLYDALLATLSSELCLDTSRIFSTGHSFGAYMSNTLACARSEEIRAFGAVAGGGPFFPCQGPVAAWIAHSMLDGTVPYSEGLASRDRWVTLDGCSDVTEPWDGPATCDAYQDCDPDAPVVWCPNEEAALDGHAWPQWAGEAIWDFFARF